MVNRGANKKMVLKMKNKKGVMFTLLAIILLSLFFLGFSMFALVENREAINDRVSSLNNFVFSVEKDLPRQLYISGFRTIFLFEKRILETGNYITNFNSTFKENFYNGTLYGEDQDLMIGATFPEIIDNINLKADKINANVSLSNPSIEVFQEDPWNIKIILTVAMKVEDKSGLASWNKTQKIVAYVPVEGFEDPLYVVNGNGLVSNKINQTIYTDFVSGADVSNLQDHLENSYYINSSEAPSFIDRLQGKTSSNPNGIESLVYLPKLSAQGIAIKDKCAVDHVYFSSSTPEVHIVAGMPSWFKIDDAHVGLYEVSGLIS